MSENSSPLENISLTKDDSYRFKISEDWSAVVIGILLIGLIITGISIDLFKTGWKNYDDLSKIFSGDNMFRFIITYVIFQTATVVSTVIRGKSIIHSIKGFPFVFLLTFVAQLIAGNSQVKDFGLEAVIFSLLIGLLINNIFQIPTWLKESLESEFFTKVGLVILGTGILFNDIIKAGSLGMIQAIVVVISVWYFAYWICKKLKIDDELAMMISSSVSICGVSAAIATAGAIKGDGKKLSYVISLVLVVAIPMIIFLPYAARILGLPESVAGAWLGGTIDTTGAVVASGSLIGETALKISTIIKFSQNVLLGFAAFAISLFWIYKKDITVTEKPSLYSIWERFPKFVIGFILVSIIFSFIVPSDIIKDSKDTLKGFQNLWFGIAFTCIGLETRLRDFLLYEKGKPAIAFLIAQIFNIILCLAVAYFLFK